MKGTLPSKVFTWNQIIQINVKWSVFGYMYIICHFHLKSWDNCLTIVAVKKDVHFPIIKALFFLRKCKSLLSLFNKITSAVHTCYLDIQDLPYALFSCPKDLAQISHCIVLFSLVLYNFQFVFFIFYLYDCKTFNLCYIIFVLYLRDSLLLFDTKDFIG